MSSVFQIVSTLVRWGVTLAVTGGLVSATQHIVAEAASAKQSGLVSLTGLNRQLMGPRGSRHQGRQAPKRGQSAKAELRRYGSIAN